MIFHYICSECSKEYEITPELMVCPLCSEGQLPDEPVKGVLETVLEGSLPENFGVLDLFPVEKKYFPSIPVGNTPLWKPEIIRKKSGFPNLYIKDEGSNPTGSLKDRASFLVAAFAVKHKIDHIILASTGNAGSSMAGIGAAAGLNITLFLPENAPPAKMVQAQQYGADVIRVKGTYDLAYNKSLDYVKKNGGMSRSTAYNPLTIEGKKSAAVEICKQLGTAPDYVFVSVGDGVIISGLYKGFRDLKMLGVINKIPLIYAVQAKGSSAIYRAFNNNGKFTAPEASDTIADSISVDIPRNGYYALKQLMKYSGKCVIVEDEEILKAQIELSSESGLFTEPAGAASYAGFLNVKKDIPANAVVVLLATGNGLKDISSAKKGLKIGV